MKESMIDGLRREDRLYSLRWTVGTTQIAQLLS